MIDTIFYFVNDYDTYQETRETEGISPRTIVFVAENKAIYKDGVRYGGYNAEEAKQLIDDEIDDKLPAVNSEIEGLQNAIDRIDDSIDAANDSIDGLESRIDGIVESKRGQIVGIINSIFSEYSWLKKAFSDVEWGNIFNSTGFNDELGQYLQVVGLMDQDGNATWTSLTLGDNSLSAKVNQLWNNQINQSMIEGWINDGISGISLSTLAANGALDALLTGYLTIDELWKKLLGSNSAVALSWADWKSSVDSATTSIGSWVAANHGNQTLSEAVGALLINAGQGTSTVDLTSQVNSLTGTDLDAFKNALKNTAGVQLSSDLDSAMSTLFSQTIETLISEHTAGFTTQTDVNHAVATMYAQGTSNSFSDTEKYFCYDGSRAYVAGAVETYQGLITADFSTLKSGDIKTSTELAALINTGNAFSPAVTAAAIKQLDTPILIKVENSENAVVGSYLFTDCTSDITSINGGSTTLKAAVQTAVEGDSAFVSTLVQAANNQAGLITESNLEESVANLFTSSQSIKPYYVEDIDEIPSGETYTFECGLNADALHPVLVDVKTDTEATIMNKKYFTAAELVSKFDDPSVTLSALENLASKDDLHTGVYYVRRYNIGTGDAIYWKITKDPNNIASAAIQRLESGFISKADQDATYAQIFASQGDLEAKISTAISNGESWIKMIADRVSAENDDGAPIVEFNSTTALFLGGKIKIPSRTISMQGSANATQQVGWVVQNIVGTSKKAFYQNGGFNVQTDGGRLAGAFVVNGAGLTDDLDFYTNSSPNPNNTTTKVENYANAVSGYDERISLVLDSDLVTQNNGKGYAGIFHYLDLSTDTYSTTGEFYVKGFATLWAPVNSNTSDERVKNIIDVLNPSIEDIANTRIVNYRFKKEDENAPLKLGSIAQDWLDIFPSAVPTDEDGNLGMLYGPIALASAVTAAREIVALKEENALLKARLAAIEERLGIVVE